MDRKNVLTCCQTRDLGLPMCPQRACIVREALKLRPALNSLELCSPTKLLLDRIRFRCHLTHPLFSRYPTAEGPRFSAARAGGTLSTVGPRETRHDALAQLRTLSDFPIYRFAPMRCSTDQAKRDTTGSNESFRVRLPGVFKRLLDRVVTKHQGRNAYPSLGSERDRQAPLSSVLLPQKHVAPLSTNSHARLQGGTRSSVWACVGLGE